MARRSARPQPDQTLDIIREIAREDGLSFRMAVVAADVPRAELNKAIAAGRVRPVMDSTFALALAARYMLSKDAKSADAELYRERALQAAEKALPWERAHIFALFGLIEDPYSSLAATEGYIAANPSE